MSNPNRTDRTPGEQLAARILDQNPDFGSVGYVAGRPPVPGIVELLERLRAPRGSRTLYLPGPFKNG